MNPAKGILFDYGGTLVEEVSTDLRAGNEWLLAHASHIPAGVGLEQVLDRAERITIDVSGRRDRFGIETPWPTLTRLIHDFLGIRFALPMAELEMGFWRAAVRTQPMPGARAMLASCHELNLPMAVVSNTSFSEPVIRYELEKNRLTEHLAFVMVSVDYSVRKPNPLLLETAAARLGVDPHDIWFVGDRLDTDVAGAKAAGMTAVWFNRVRDQLSEEPHLTIDDWSALVGYLAAEAALPQT
jgi:putative hydrolase of the HAD superfamily